MKRLILWAAVAALALPLVAENPETAVERSHARAKQVLEEAVEANGGRDAINNVKNVRIKIAGEFIPRYQTASAEPPFEAGWFEEETILDLEKNRTAVWQKNKGAGFRGKQRIVINGKDSATFDLLNKTVTPIDATNMQQPQFVQYQRRLPSLILRTALGRDATLRYLGEEVVNGSKHDVITFVHQDGFQMALYIDGKSRLISKYELIYPDTLYGDEASEIYYQGYKKVGGVMVPSAWLWKQAGEVIAKYSYDVSFDQQLADSTFDTKTDGFTAQQPNLAAQRKVEVEKLGDGVYLVNNLGGGGYNVMAVEFSDHIVAVEAPLSTQVASQAIAEIKKAIPNKPIRYVAISHHHNDHSGGLRAFIAEGATVVTTPGNINYVKALAASKHVKDSLTENWKPLKLEMVEKGKRVFTDGKQRLELLDVGPNPHAKEMLVGYLPDQKILFQGDLFFSPFNGQQLGFAQEGTQHFAAKVRELGLQVEKLAGVHGKVGSLSELDQSIELAKKMEGDQRASD